MATKKSNKVKDTAEEVLKLFTEFFGGIQRDDKSTVRGGMSDVEELDILENANWVQPTQVLSADTLPANTNFFSYCEDPLLGMGYAIGADNNGNGFAHVFSNSNIGTQSATGWSDAGGASATLVSNAIAPSIVHYEIENGASTVTPTLALYFITGTNTVTKWTASGGVASTTWVLSSLTSSMSHISFREINGLTYICAGNYVSTIDPGSQSTGPNFNEKALALPSGYVSIDICQAGEYFFVLAAGADLIANKSVIFIWDGVSQQYTDQIPVPMGGPQWIYNFKNTVTLLCSANGKAKPFYLNAPSTGAICKAYSNISLKNVQLENQSISLGNSSHTYTCNVPISPSKGVFVKDDILYFTLWKTDKSAIYALGQLNSESPFALWLAKRFDTSDYSQIIPYAATAFGPKIFAAYQFGYVTSGSNVTRQSICDPATANRSSQAILQSVWDDDGQPMNPKDLIRAYVESYPIQPSCSLDLYVASDYSTTFTQMKQAGGMIMNILNAIFGIFRPSNVLNKKLFQWKVLFTSKQLTTTTLGAAITSAGQTIITVTSATGINVGDTLLIDSEQLTVVSGGSGTSVWVNRGVNGTLAATHSNGATISDLSYGPKLTAVGMRKIIKQLDA